MTDEQDLLVGRAVRRLLEIAAQDETVRAGLEALARSILPPAERSSEATLAAPETAPPIDAASPVEEAVEPTLEAGEAEDGVAATAEAAEPAPADDVVEPMNRATFMQLMEEVARQVEPAELGSMAASLRDAAGVPESPPPEPAPVAHDRLAEDAAAPAPTREERDALLPALAERTRLKAELARAVAAQVRTGAQPDGSLLHRARSAHCSLWILELRSPDADALEELATCFDATSEALDVIHLLRTHDPGNQERFAASVRRLAAVQSALRIAAPSLRHGPDDDQVAVFGWLKTTTASERIFVERHMRLDDPLEPALVPTFAADIRAELDAIREQIDEGEARERGFKQVRYHVGRIAKGKGSAHDGDKVVEAVTALVEDGLPPSNLELRGLLTPVLDQLPGAVDRPAAYARVIADVAANRGRPPKAKANGKNNGKAPVAPSRPASDEVRRAAALLRGTELVLIGGERRPEHARKITDAFGLAELTWFTLSDDPTLDELERVISRRDVSVVIQLIRWTRHRHGDAAELAEAHGKPFVRVPGGYNENALARAILDQASERLGAHP